MADDFFAGLNQEAPPTQEIPEQQIISSEETQPAPLQVPPPPQPTESERYWQSQADRYKAEVDQYKQFGPVIKQLVEDPALTQLYIDYMQGKTQQSQEPSLPTPPTDFDPYQMTDPQSSSAQYLKTVVMTVAGQIAEQKTREALEQYAVTQQQQLQLREQITRLKGRHQGLDEGFAQFVADPQNVTPDNWMDALAEVYLKMKGNTTMNPGLARVEQNTLRRGPIVNVSSEAQGQIATPEDEFWGGIQEHLKVSELLS